MENKLSIKERNEQLQHFVDYVETQRNLYKGCPKDIAITLDNLVSIGMDMDTIVWLRKNHYISVQKGKPIWIAWDNKFYPKSTIANLKKWLKVYFLKKIK